MKTLFEGKKLYAVIIAFLLMITFFITLHIIRNHYQYVVKETIAENKLKARFLSSLIYEHQKAAISILESYAQRPLFIDAVKKKDFHRAIYHLKSLSEHHSEIDAIVLYDQYGTIWANYPVSKEGFGKNFAYRDLYKGVSRTWRPYISTLYRRVVQGKGLAVAVSVPVFDRKGKVIGILCGIQHTYLFATFIKENISDPKKNIALLDQEGNIMFSNALPYQEKITKYTEVRVLEKAVAGVTANMEIADAKDKDSISYVSIAPVRGIGWSVIVGQAKDAILKQLYGYFILSTVAGFVIFLLFTVSLLYFRREYKYRKTKELLQAEEKYRSIFENAIEGIFQSTTDGRFLAVNPAFARIHGYKSPEEVIQSVTDIKKQLYADPIRREEFIRVLHEQGVVTNFEHQQFRKDGSTIWVRGNARAVRDDNNNVLYYEGTIEDITDRKQAEEALKKSVQLLRDTGEMAKVGGWELDLKTNEVSWTEEVNKIHGTGPGYRPKLEEAMNFYVPESRPALEEALKKAAETGEPYDLESLFIPSGSKDRIWVRSLGRAVYSGGKIVKLAGTFQNIDKYKRAEEELRLSEENFRRSLDDSPLGVRIVTMEGETIYANRAILDIYGYDSLEELKTTPVENRYTPESFSEHQIRKEKRKRGDDVPSEYDISVVKKDDEFRHLQVFRKEILWDGERQFQVLYNDITERKKAEEELRESEERYRTVAQLISEFAYSCIHAGDDGYEVDWITDAFFTLTGYSEAELHEQRCWLFVSHPDDREMATKPLHELKAGESDTREFRIVTKGGLVLYIISHMECQVDPKAQGGLRLFGAVQNITEHKKVEEEKHRLEERSRKVVEDIFRFIPEGVLVFSRKMELLRQNQAFRDLVTGYARRLGFAEDELENLIIDKVKAGMRDNNIKEIKIARKHEPGKET